VKAVVSLLTLAFVALLLRSTALSALAARGVVLDVLTFVTVLWALRQGESWGSTFGFVLGLFADLDAAHWLGRHALALALVGYVAGRLRRTVVRDSARTQLVLFFLATLVHQAWVALFESGGLASAPLVAGRIVLAAAVSAAAGTALLGMVRRLGGQPLFGHAAAGSGPSA
jgi:rod shape-determining protein MreD